jgi:hypothetical protein
MAPPAHVALQPTLCRRATRCRLAAWALAFAAVAPASSAVAQTPAGPHPPPPPAPHVEPAAAGLPPSASWEQTVAAYEARIAELERQIRLVEKLGSSEEYRIKRPRLELDLLAAQDALDDFKERTTERNSSVMMFSGLAVAILGGVAVLSGAVLGMTERAQDRRHGYDTAVATALGGVGALAVGLPLYAIGKKKVRKDVQPSEPVVVVARAVVGPGAAVSTGAGTLGVGLRCAF